MFTPFDCSLISEQYTISEHYCQGISFGVGRKEFLLEMHKMSSLMDKYIQFVRLQG